MKNRESSTPIPSSITWSDGHTTSGGVAYNIDTLHVLNDNTVLEKELKPKAFRFWKVSSSALRGQATRNNPASGYFGFDGGINSAFGNDTPILLPSEASNWRDVAYNKAVADLGDKLRPVDVSVDLLQFRMSLKTASRLLNLTKTLKKSYEDAVKRRGPVKELANLYLEWTYGVEPTLKTLLELYKHLHSSGLSGQSLAHFRGRGSIKDYRQTTMTAGPIMNYTNCVVKVASHASVRCQIDVYIKPNLTEIQKLSGYTTLNPIQWAYELMPYSFVLDWFYNLGGYMRGLETAMVFAPQFHSGCRTYTWDVLNTALSQKYLCTDGQATLNQVAGSHTYREYDRVVLTAFPLPVTPVLRCDMGARRVLNAAALLSQFLPDLHSKVHGSNRRLLRP